MRFNPESPSIAESTVSTSAVSSPSAQSASPSVQLLDNAGNPLGTFTTIQAAVDAAGSFPGVPVIIIVGDGVYNENVIIDRGDLSLISQNGRGSTTIIGDSSGSALGTIEIDPNVNNVTIGSDGISLPGGGFTIVGINGPAGLEKAAIYLQGNHDNIAIFDNEVRANGDAGLLSEFGATVSNVRIDGNEFSGQTFLGSQPAGDGFGQQFTLDNVPRQLVVLSGGNGGGNHSSISFTNNLVSGTAGGINADGNPQGNTLVTIDAANSLISANEFTGDTARFATAIRARGPETDIIDNILSGESRGIFIQDQGQPGTYSGNVFQGTAINDVVNSMTPGDDTMVGGNGNDVFGGDGGNDDITGGAGTDTVGYVGVRDDYTISKNLDGTYTVTDNNPADGDNGTDTLTTVEGVAFTGTLAPSTAAIIFELDVNSPDYSGALQRFANDFESGTDGLIENGSTVTLETFEGRNAARLSQSDAGGAFTRFDGYRSTDTEGFTTSVKVYLDTNMATGEGFDYAVAASNQAGGHLRDFIFHVTKDTSTGELLVSGSNNTNFAPREDLDTQNHAVIETSGWYTFEHKFYENEDGDLEVAMNVYDDAGDWVFTEIRSNPGDDFATAFGGNRYGWFTNVDVTGGIAIDDLTLSTLDTNPVQVFEGNNVIASYATVAEAKTALENGDISAATAFIETSGLDDGFFYVVEGMSIQAAVNAASAGDRVEVAAGTFAENVLVDEDITLEGANADLAGADGTRGAESILTGTITLGSDGVTISGFEFDPTSGQAIRGGVNSTVNFSDITITNNDFVGLVTDANQFITNGFGIGGADNGAGNWVISANRFDGATGVNQAVMRIDNIDGLTLTDNVIFHDDAAASGRRGIQLFQVDNAVIQNNTVDMGADAGSGLANLDLFNAAKYSLQLESVSNVLVDGNSFSNSYDGVITLGNGSVTDVTISNNTFSGQAFGIRTQAGTFGEPDTAEHSNLAIVDNSFTTSREAIRLSGDAVSANDPYVGLNINGNTVTQGSLLTDIPVSTFAGINMIPTGTFDGAIDVNGTVLSDRLFGGSADNTMFGGAGDDSLNGDGGFDTLILNDNGGVLFNATDYDFTGLTVTAGSVSGTLVGPDGTDAIDSFELLQVTGVTAGGTSTFVVLDGMDLQAAIDAAQPGDNIYLQDGTFLDDEGNIIRDIVDGTGGSDAIDGTNGADSIDASGGNDTVNGMGGSDLILGGSGADTLFGGAGDDEIDGGSGNDVIGGGDGADTLTGGTGNDTFVVEAGKTAADADVITDFRSNDRIAIADADGRDIVIQQSGSNVEILADGVLVVTLLDTQANRVTNLVEYEGTPASIDAPSGRGRSRFSDDFDFDSFDFGSVVPDVLPEMPQFAPMSLSMTEVGGTQVTFESLFGGASSPQPNMDGGRFGLDAGLDNSWLRQGLFETDHLA